MKISNEVHVSMDYTLRLSSGEVVDQSDPSSPIEFVCGHDQIIPGLEKRIMGKAANDSFTVEVAPEEAYGEHHAEMVQEIPSSQFPPNVELKVGMTFQSKTPQGQPLVFSVKEVQDDAVVVDMNHPLAGKTLVFDVVIRSVREATPEEIEALNAPECDPGDTSECGGGCSCG